MSTSGLNLRMSDTDPFELRAPGAMSGTTHATLRMSDTDPFELRMPGATYGSPSRELATPVAPLEPTASAHADSSQSHAN